MSTFNAEVAEAMTYNIIKQTIGHLVKHGMLKPHQRGECLTLFTSMMSKKTRGRGPQGGSPGQEAGSSRG